MVAPVKLNTIWECTLQRGFRIHGGYPISGSVTMADRGVMACRYIAYSVVSADNFVSCVSSCFEAAPQVQRFGYTLPAAHGTQPSGSLSASVTFTGGEAWQQWGTRCVAVLERWH